MTNRAPDKAAPTTPMPENPPAGEAENEGEGNRTADREYREHVARHLKSGKSEPAAEDAARALEGEEADDLREAERQGKAADTRPREGKRTRH